MAEKDIPDSLKDLTDQFKEMHQSLDKLAESHKPVEKVAKLTLDHHHKPTPPTPKVELGKETRKDILSALKSIRQQIVVSQRKENTAADVAAEHLAAGGGLAGAAGEALAFKAGKFKAAFKRKFDPLNIVNRISGGSKLATVLAGRLMGRSEKSIRGASGLGGGLPGMEMQDQFGQPSPYMGQDNSPSAVASEKATGLLEQISATLTTMLKHITDLEASSSKIEQYTKDSSKFAETQTASLDKMGDEAAEERAKQHRGPQQIAKTGEPAKQAEADNGWMGTFMRWFIGLGAAAVVIIKLWKDLTNVFSMLGDSISDMYNSIKSGLGAVKDWISDKITGAMDAVLDTVDDVVDGIKDLAGSIIPGYTASTPEQKRQEKHDRNVKDAAAGNSRAIRALEKEVSSPSAAGDVLKKMAPKFASKIPTDARGASLESLQKGDLIDPAIKSLSGEESPKGSPERVSTTNALTQMVAQAYGELYKDKLGNPMRPSQDPQRETRLPELVKSASAALAEAAGPVSGASPAPDIRSSLVTETPGMTVAQAIGAPDMMAPMPPATGQMLNQASENQKNASVSGAGTNVVAPVIHNNKTVNNTSSTTIHQNMPPARSGESSFLRSQDSSFARA